MARADLLLKLVKSGASGDKQLFKKVVQSMIAEEKQKQHHILAKQLEEILEKGTSGNGKVNGVLNGSRPSTVEQFLIESIPQQKLTDLFFEDFVFQEINELKEEYFRSDLLRSYNLEPRNRILFVGEPGTGKTSLAEGLAQELMLPFFTVRYDGIIGSYLGETASRLRKMFDYISTQQCVLFFDEFDAIGKERGDIHETGEIKRVVNSLLLQIDKLPSYVIIIAATNHPELLDRAVWRRFQVRMELKKPSKTLIEQYIGRFKKDFNQDIGYKASTIASKLEGYSFSEIEEFAQDILRKYVLSLPDAKMKIIINKSMERLSKKYSQS